MYSLMKEIVIITLLFLFILLISCVLSYHAGYIKGVNYKQQPIDIIRY